MNPVQQLYDHYASLRRAHKPPQLRFRPSEIGGCKREIFYRLRGDEPRPISPDTHRLFEDGNLHHDQVRRDMLAAGVEMLDLEFTDAAVTETGGATRKFATEVGGVEYEVELSGRNDGRLAFDGVQPVLEIKSVNKWKYEKFQNAFLKGGEKAVLEMWRDQAKKKAGARPEPEHANRRLWMQVQATLLLLGAERAYVIMKNKDFGQIGFTDKEGGRHGIMVEADPGTQAEVLKRCAVVLKALSTNTPPNQEFPDGSSACSMCGFYPICWGSLK